MRTIYLDTKDPFILGKTGESNRTALRVNVESWYQEYPDGNGVILFMRPNRVVFPLETNLIEYNGEHYLEAIVTSNETKLAGFTVVTAQWYDGESLVHGLTFSGKVLTSAGSNPTDGVTETTPTWVSRLIAEIDVINEASATAAEAYEKVQYAVETIDRALAAADETVEEVNAVAEQVNAAKDLTNTYKDAAAASATAAATSAEHAMDATPEGYAALVGSIAQAYSTAQAYAVGDLVMKDGQLYRCVTAIGEDGEAWTAGHWTAVTVGGEVGNLKTAIDYCSEGKRLFTQADMERGSYNSSGATTSATNRVRVKGFIKVIKGESIIFEPGETIDQFVIGCFSTNKTFIGDLGWFGGNQPVEIVDDGYIIIAFKNSGNTTIDVSDYDATTYQVSYTENNYIDLKATVDSVTNETASPIGLEWEHGGINLETGENTEDGATTRSRTGAYYPTYNLSAVYNHGIGSARILYVILYTKSDSDVYTFYSAARVNINESYSFSRFSNLYVRFDIRTGLANAKDIELKGYSNVNNDVAYHSVIGSNTYCKNLVGEDTRVLYPCKIEPGEYMTLTTSDGEIVDKANVTLFWYDENKAQIETANFTRTKANRTVQNTTGRTIRYMRWYTVLDNDRHLQVERGRVPTSYQPYFPNLSIYDDSMTAIDNLNNSWNSANHRGMVDFKTPCSKFSELMSGDTVNSVDAVSECEAFAFFTDPHTQTQTERNRLRFEDYLGQIQKVYRSTPARFAICGGDWLGNGDTPSEACYKLGLVGASCKSIFDSVYLLVGNHDYNYQGKKDSESANYTTRLPIESIENLWYNGKKAYYSFDGSTTKFYCFDTGTETQTLSDFGNYGYEQGEWFAQKLIADDAEHSAIAMHMYYVNDAQTDWSTIGHYIMQIASLYNTRGSITINGHAYNFADCTGLVEFAITGHTHFDANYVFTENSAAIPVIVTKDVANGQTFPVDATFDLVFVDYDNREIKCIRVGSGNDRTLSLA